MSSVLPCTTAHANHGHDRRGGHASAATTLASTATAAVCRVKLAANAIAPSTISPRARLRRPRHSMPSANAIHSARCHTVSTTPSTSLPRSPTIAGFDSCSVYGAAPK